MIYSRLECVRAVRELRALALARIGLAERTSTDHVRSLVTSCSGKRLCALAIANALFWRTSPMGNFDSRGGMIFTLLKEIAADRTVVVVTDVEPLAADAKRVIGIWVGERHGGLAAQPGGGQTLRASLLNSETRSEPRSRAFDPFSPRRLATAG